MKKVGINVSKYLRKVVEYNMNYFFDRHNRYKNIIEFLCQYKGVSEGELFKILEDEDCKYLLALLLKKYECLNQQEFHENFPSSKVDFKEYMKNAEEKMLFNKRIRDMYFEAEELLDKKVK